MKDAVGGLCKCRLIIDVHELTLNYECAQMEEKRRGHMPIALGKAIIYYHDLQIMKDAFCSHTTNAGNEPDDNQPTCPLVVNAVNAASLYGLHSTAHAAFRET